MEKKINQWLFKFLKLQTLHCSLILIWCLHCLIWFSQKEVCWMKVCTKGTEGQKCLFCLFVWGSMNDSWNFKFEESSGQFLKDGLVYCRLVWKLLFCRKWLWSDLPVLFHIPYHYGSSLKFNLIISIIYWWLGTFAFVPTLWGV